MGYRSDVAIAIYGPEKVMVPFLAAQRMTTASPLVLEKDYIEQREYTKDGEPWILLTTYQESVKWYPSYPCVAAWSALLGEISDNCEQTGLTYEFIRIGEENDDIESDYSGDCEWYLNIHRSIVFDTPPMKEATNEPSK
jgi:hypothetical protein